MVKVFSVLSFDGHKICRREVVALQCSWTAEKHDAKFMLFYYQLIMTWGNIFIFIFVYR